jgi:hypothetical protein
MKTKITATTILNFVIKLISSEEIKAIGLYYR